MGLVLAGKTQAGLADEISYVEIESYQELAQHSPTPAPVITVPWLDESRGADGGAWQFSVKVDETGRVVSADLVDGPEQQRAEAITVVRTSQFQPFEREGRFVKATFPYFVNWRTADYAGPRDRAFPDKPVLDDTSIKLRRSACFGPCPVYEIEVRGDGQVRYRGESDVLITGNHQWRIPATDVGVLLERFRHANYFKLDGYYIVNATDLPSYLTQVRIGSQRKFVFDYGGSGSGVAVASTSFGGPAPNMPAVVTELENAIDVLSGANSWTIGDDKTIAALERSAWNFKSAQSGKALQYLLSNCNVPLALEFIERGAPLDVQAKGWSSGTPIVLASQCADVQIVQLLESEGALSSEKVATAFLFASVESGDPNMVRVALRHQHDVNIKDSDGKPLLFYAAELVDDESGADDQRARSFDADGVIRMLVDAGVDVGMRDGEGNTALHEVFDVTATLALLAAGADPNARNAKGETPMFNKYADLESLQALMRAGADVNATDIDGHVPLESARFENDALNLMSLGARPSKDPVRFRSFIDYAKEAGWTRVLAKLE